MAPLLTCPEVDVWKQLLLGNLPEAEVEALSEHLQACTRCTQAVQTVQAEDLLTQTVRATACDAQDLNETAIQGLIERMSQLKLPALAEGLTAAALPAAGPPAENATVSLPADPPGEATQEM
jgi:anti-sigma factor RsiW